MTDNNTSQRAARRFRWLLQLLPAEFRGDYGPEMEQVFAEQRAEADRAGDKMGMWRLWWETAKGIFTTAPREHLAMLRQDSGFALRMMRKNLGFTIAAIVVLGLGIGANTAIFSVVDAVLLRPLPYKHGEQLVLLTPRASDGQSGLFSVPEMNDYRQQNRSLDGIVEYHNMQFILLGRQEPEHVETGVVSWNFFDIFGVKPLAGRMFEPSDEKPGAPAVLLLSFEYWQRSFGGDPTVVGKKFRMNDKLHTVIGVLPPFPQYPKQNDVYMPSTACPFRSDPDLIANRQGHMLRLFGRMKPGITATQSEADLTTLRVAMGRTYPNDYPQDSPARVLATPLKTELTRDAKPTMLFLLAAAGFVLLIACANVANLNLARMVRREREMGLRAAMGAGRVCLFRQLLTESFLLALGGGALGLLLAASGLQLLTTYVARFTPRAHEVHVDAQVLLFTLLIAGLASILTGTAPALARRENLSNTLKEGGTHATLGTARSKTRSALIVAQVAVSFLLLAPSLITRTAGDPMNIARATVQHLYEVDPNQPAGKIQSLEQVRADSIAAPRLTANLLGLFALLALAIAAAGIGGVLALSVSQRTHEIGVRMAIGARPSEIVRMILRQGMGLVLAGLLLGVAGAVALTHTMTSFLFGVTPTDPATFALVAAVLLAVAFAACYIPARRAAQVDPLRALRAE